MTTEARSALSRIASVFGGLSAFLRVAFIVITVFFMALKSAAPEMGALYLFLGCAFLLALLALFSAWVQLATRQTLWLKPEAPSALAADLAKFPQIRFAQNVGLLWFVWMRPHQEGLKKPALKPKKGSRGVFVFVLALMIMGASALPMALAYLIAVLSHPFVGDVTQRLELQSVGQIAPMRATAAPQSMPPAQTTQKPTQASSTVLNTPQVNVVQRRGQKPSGDDFVIWKR